MILSMNQYFVIRIAKAFHFDLFLNKISSSFWYWMLQAEILYYKEKKNIGKMLSEFVELIWSNVYF